MGEIEPSCIFRLNPNFNYVYNDSPEKGPLCVQLLWLILGMIALLIDDSL
jgi:hypothetical protein